VVSASHRNIRWIRLTHGPNWLGIAGCQARDIDTSLLSRPTRPRASQIYKDARAILDDLDNRPLSSA
jgi:hypothetical protein